jgi:Uma2 family endonuclease
MSTLLRIEAETLPRVLVFDPPMTDEEFEALCCENDGVQFERTKEGAIRAKPPAGGWTSSGNLEISRQLGNWWAEHKRGGVFDSSGGFRLPDGSTLSPDASYLSEKQLKNLPKGALRSFPRVCPDFVIELLSESDTLERLKSKMTDWISNGALLAWLVDPYERRVLVYRPNQEPERVAGRKVPDKVR